MNRFTLNSFKRSKMSGLLGVFAFIAFLFSSTLTQAQSSNAHCPTPSVMTGTVTSGIQGLCLLCGVNNPQNAGDASLSTGAAINMPAGIGATGWIHVGGSTTYPAGSVVTAVVQSGGSTILSALIGNLLTDASIILTMDGTPVQTISSSSGLLELNLLGGFLGGNQGAIGGTADQPFNGVRFEYSPLVSVLTGWTVNGMAVVKGCATFNNCGSNVTAQTSFFANGSTGQTGTITLPLSSVRQGGTKISVTGGGFTRPASNFTLTQGQTSIEIPVTFDGSGLGGERTITVTQHDFITGAALPNGTCTYKVNVTGPFEVTNVGPINKTSGGFGTTTPGNATTDLVPVGGVSPYTYLVVNCANGTTTSQNATTATQTTTYGSVTINKNTGVYTYTPNATYGAAGDQFCVKVCDATTPTAACETVTYFVTPALATYAYNCPTGALVVPSGVFTANGTGSQNGTVRIPLTGVTAGSATFTLTSTPAGITSTPTPYNVMLAANQQYVDIPVTYNGSGAAGNRTITVTSPSGNTSSSCNSGTVPVTQGFGLGNATPTITTNTGTPYNSNAAATQAAISVSGGTAPYIYSAVNCTTDLPSTATSQGGTISLNANTGAYTYTPAAGFSGTDTYCIKVCDSSVPANCQTATYTATVGTPPGTVSTVNCNSGSAVAATANQPYSGSNTVNYTGGNSGSYLAQTVNSTGITGLTATLAAGNFTSGAGSVQYNISGTPSAQGTATFNITLGGQSCSFTVNVTTVTPPSPPSVSSNPNPPVAGQSLTLSASGCAGTVTWFNNGTQVGTGTPFTTTAVAGANYTATCTVNGVASNPSSPITVPSGNVDLTVFVSSFPGTVFTVGTNAQKTYQFTVRNTGTTAYSGGGTLNISNVFGGYNVSGTGSQTIPALAAGASTTYSVSITATSAGAAANITATIPPNTGGETNNNNNIASVSFLTTNP